MAGQASRHDATWTTYKPTTAISIPAIFHANTTGGRMTRYDLGDGGRKQARHLMAGRRSSPHVVRRQQCLPASSPAAPAARCHCAQTFAVLAKRGMPLNDIASRSVSRCWERDLLTAAALLPALHTCCCTCPTPHIHYFHHTCAPSHLSSLYYCLLLFLSSSHLPSLQKATFHFLAPLPNIRMTGRKVALHLPGLPALTLQTSCVHGTFVPKELHTALEGLSPLLSF